MRVLFVTGEYPPLQGGVGDYTSLLTGVLRVQGVELDVLTTSGPASEPHVDRVVGRWGWRAVLQVRNQIRIKHPDIVHIQYQTAAYGMHPAINLTPRIFRSPIPFLRPDSFESARTRKNCLFVTTFHDLQVPYLFPKAGAVRDWITFELARSSDAVIGTNEEDCERLARHLGLLPSCIPIGSNIRLAPPHDYDRAHWRASLGVAPSELLLSYFGFLNDSKGGMTLVQALQEIPNAKLIMVGGQVGASDRTNVAYLARVKELISELGLGSRIKWTDYTQPPEVSANLLASDICVLPYRDGASFRRGSFMAALAHGLAIITTASPPHSPASSDALQGLRQRELSSQIKGKQCAQAVGMRLPSLVDGENVLLVRPDNPTALANAVKRLAGDPVLDARLRAGALQLATSFAWDRIAARHIELYEQLTGNPTRIST